MKTAPLFAKVQAFHEMVEQTRAAGLYAYFRELVSEANGEARLANGRMVLMLGSNNYLGLSHHPAVRRAAAEAAERYGTGCAGSAVLNGTLSLHKELERELAAFVGKAAAVLFPTGFQTNQGAVTALAGRHDALFMDRLNHASLVDAARLSLAEVHKFRHNDMADLAACLVRTPPERGKFIVADGVFSMDGDILDLPGVVRLAGESGAAVMVDDAHGLGVLGPEGRGTAAHFGLTDQVDLIMGTFSKSLASVGGFVAGAADLIEFLRHTARAGLFSASLPPPSAAAVLAALRVMREEPWRRERLWQNSEQLRNGLRNLGFNTGCSVTPVIPILVGRDEAVFAFCLALEEAGVFANPVVSPAVPPNEAILRLSVTAAHEPAQLDNALTIFARVGRQCGIIS